MFIWGALNQDIFEEEQRARREEIKAIYVKREQLAAAGYISPSERLRSRTAGWLLRLAMLLDKRIAETLPTPSALRHA